MAEVYCSKEGCLDPAKTTRDIAYRDTRYQIPLCKKHADEIDIIIYGSD